MEQIFTSFKQSLNLVRIPTAGFTSFKGAVLQTQLSLINFMRLWVHLCPLWGAYQYQYQYQYQWWG